MLSQAMITEAVGRGYGSEKNSGKTMDTDIAKAIVCEIMKLPGMTEVDVEQELGVLYQQCEETELKLVVLESIHELQIGKAVKIKDNE